MFLRSIILLILLYSIAFSNFQKKELIISTSNSWPPFSYITQDKEPKGMLIDFWKEFAKTQNINIKFKLSDWNETLNNVKHSKADIHSGLFKSKERARYFDFTKALPIILSTKLFIKKDIDASTFSDLKNKYVGVTRGGFAQNYIKKKYPNTKLKLYPNSFNAVEAASNNEIIAFVADFPVGVHHLKKFKISEQFNATFTLYSKNLYAAVKKGDKELLKFVSIGINNISEDDINRIVNKWVLSVEVIPQWLIFSILSLIGFLITTFLLIYVFLLKKQVKQRTKELEILSQTDKLTKCLNRQKLDEIFTTELSRHKRYNSSFSIIFLDIDDFKMVNDKYGHAVGDEVLILISKILKENIRSTDFLGRWGGEEFLIICPEINIKESNILATKLCNKINSTVFPTIKKCTASFGITQAKENDNIKNIFNRVDKALYEAKKSGKNQVVSNL